MVWFLTSYYAFPGTNTLSTANGFDTMLKAALPASALRGVCVASSAEDLEKSERYGYMTRDCLRDAGIPFESYVLLDARNSAAAKTLVKQADLLILSGGHTPSQNRFFRQLGLKALLRDFSGVVLGISAGSMNSAETVYAQPERPGEALDPAYARFLPGLGLTRTMLLPHHQTERHAMLDGLRLYEDIAFPDSCGRCFYSIPDGSFLYGDGKRQALYGEAWRIQNGVMECVCRENEILPL